MKLIKNLNNTIDNIKKIIVKEDDIVEIQLEGYRNSPKLRTHMKHNAYEYMDSNFQDGIYTLTFKPITGAAELLGNKIETIAEQDFTREFNYVELDQYNDNRITLVYSVEGGYEADVNAYYGGSEYVDDFVEVVKEIPDVTRVSYDLDESDLTGELIVEYS